MIWHHKRLKRDMRKKFGASARILSANIDRASRSRFYMNIGRSSTTLVWRASARASETENSFSTFFLHTGRNVTFVPWEQSEPPSKEIRATLPRPTETMKLLCWLRERKGHYDNAVAIGAVEPQLASRSPVSLSLRLSLPMRLSFRRQQ